MATAECCSDVISIIEAELEIAVDKTDSNQDHNDSLTKESDQVLEMFCEHCDKELGTIVTVDGFCVNCFEYLCKTCLRYHLMYKPGHIIQDRDSMPQDVYKKKCQEHSKQLIKFHCMSCKQTACTVCKVNNHTECTIEHIPSHVRSAEFKNEASKVIKAIKNEITEIADAKKEIASKLLDIKSVRENLKTSITKHSDILIKDIEDNFKRRVSELEQMQESEMKRHEKKRKELLAKLDKEKDEILNRYEVKQKKLQKNKEDTFNQIKSQEKYLDHQSISKGRRDKKELQKIYSKAEKAEQEINTLQKRLSQKILANERCEVFLTLEEADNILVKTEQITEEVRQCEVYFYRFQPSFEKVDKSCEHNAISYGSFKKLSEIKRETRISNYFRMELSTDKVHSSITGICKISDTQLIAADEANKSIKILDTDRKLISAVYLEEKPFDVTFVKKNTVATTMPQAEKIQLVSVRAENQLSVQSQIAVKGACFGIAFKKPNFIVGCPGKVQFIDLNGNVVRTIASPGVTPMQIRLDPNSNKIYTLVTERNCDENTICTLAKIMLDTKIEKITNTWMYDLQANSLTIDKYGTIFTCTTDGKIVQISEDLQTYYTHKLIPRGQSLHYCNKSSKLYVGTGAGQTIVCNVKI